MTARDDIAEAFETLRLEYDVADFTRDQLVHLLIAIRDVRADLASFAADVTKDLLAYADEKRFVVPGVGEVEIKKSTKRTGWDSESLTRRLVALALDERIVDESTGEYEPAWEAVARVLMDCARPTWRVTPLRARGIDESEYCVVTPDGWDVRLPPRRSDDAAPSR